MSEGEGGRAWLPMETAPKDGSWCEVRCIEDGWVYRSYWWPEATSWVDGELQPTGVWTDDDGWLQPDEVDGWRPCDPETPKP